MWVKPPPQASGLCWGHGNMSQVEGRTDSMKVQHILDTDRRACVKELKLDRMDDDAEHTLVRKNGGKSLQLQLKESWLLQMPLQAGSGHMGALQHTDCREANFCLFIYSCFKNLRD